MTPKPTFRHDIHALRALAVTLVVLYHFDVRGFAAGFIGVDVFFVISGYLMTQIAWGGLARGDFSYPRFLLARALRIWPALAVMVLSLLALGAVLLPPADYAALGRQAVHALLFVSHHLFNEGLGYFNSGVEERWLLHTWSLSVEWQFYMLYPLGLMGLAAILRAFPADAGQQARRATGVLAALTVLGFGYGVWLTRQDPSQAFFSLAARSGEMLAGGLVFLLREWPARLSPVWRHGLRAAALLILVGCLLAGRGHRWEPQWPGALALWPVLAAVLYLIAGQGVAGGWTWAVERTAVVQALGRWSYSIYLWHWPLMVACHYAVASAQWSGPAARLAGIAASVALGALSFRWIERPVATRVQPAIGHWRLTVPAVALGAGALAGLAVLASQGWPARLGGREPALMALQAQVGQALAPDDCERALLGPSELVFCELNAQAPGPRIVVLGDSRAQHLYAWFARHARQPVRFALSPGCPPIPATNRKDHGFRCHEVFERLRQRALAGPVDTVVLSGNWAALDQQPSNLCQVADGRCRELDADGHRAAAVHEGARLLDALAGRGLQVVLVRPTPQASTSIGPLALRRALWGQAPLQTFPDPDWAARHGDRFLDDMVAAAAHGAAVRQIDLRPAYCRDGRCEAHDARRGLPVYRDDNHFLPAWIVHHGDVLTAALAR